MLPKVLKHFNFFVDGYGYTGIAEEVTPPKISKKMESYRGGGMLGEVDIDMGYEKLESDMSLKELNPTVMKLSGNKLISGIGFRLVGVIASEETGQEDSIELVYRGRFKEIDMGTVKSGDMTTLKSGISLTYYKVIYNGEVIREIDLINMIDITNGVDAQENARNILGL